MITLYHAKECPFCARVRIVFEEKRVPYKSVEVDLNAPPEEVSRLNPRGLVPIIEENGFVVRESAIISEYLDDRFPEPSLMTWLPEKRAKIRLLIESCDADFLGPFYRLRQTRREEEQEKARAAIMPVLEYLSRELKGKKFLLGNFSMADIAFAPWMIVLDRLPGLGREQIPEPVAAWIEALRARETIGSDPYWQGLLAREEPLKRAG
ncbi:MAG: hypothetical protein A2583_13315 [Bdellovibrionales bacterium RIFOXYD1_FULL_53_11]|nr:MAG: hypothetical protein A2583_13315 [Bdellovibrionales bacterium RIFOXYD1_FULL_53_11]HLE00360.1 glutathione S-transferase family protein [Bdellovibrionota bacterium]